MRLNNSMRETIKAKIYPMSILDDAKKKYDDDVEKFFKEYYKSLFTEEEWKTLQNLPEGWVRKATSLSISFDQPIGYRRCYFKNGPLRMVEKYHGGLSIDHANSAHSKYEYIKNKFDEFEANFRETRRKIDSVLASVTTDNRLKELWPEIGTIVDKVCKGYSTAEGKSISIPICELNKKLNLQAISGEDE